MTGARLWEIALLLLGLLAQAGCGPSVCLVGDVPPPPFGRRVTSTRATSPAATTRPSRPLTRQINWIPPTREAKWTFIILHHSATETGDAAKFDKAHRARGWDELGYHFVIGNGSLSGDGEIEVGSRWRKQKRGAHCAVRGHPEYNRRGIGICLVGNFNNHEPSGAQMQSLVWLVRGLMERYDVPKSRILGHGMLEPTDCPGKQFDYEKLFHRL